MKSITKALNALENLAALLTKLPQLKSELEEIRRHPCADEKFDLVLRPENVDNPSVEPQKNTDRFTELLKFLHAKPDATLGEIVQDPDSTNHSSQESFESFIKELSTIERDVVTANQQLASLVTVLNEAAEVMTWAEAKKNDRIILPDKPGDLRKSAEEAAKSIQAVVTSLETDGLPGIRALCATAEAQVTKASSNLRGTHGHNYTRGEIGYDAYF